MADISIRKGRHQAYVIGLTPKGNRWLMANVDQRPYTIQLDVVDDLKEHLERLDLTVDVL